MSAALKNVTVKLGERPVLNGFSARFEEGKINCLLGPSGVGKTTVLNVLAGLTKFEGQAERSEKISYIFQESRLLNHLTVWENVEYVLMFMPEKERAPRIKRLLELTEIYDRRNDFPTALSGGMARRVAMARAYAYPAELLLMDEPFSALDIALKLRQMEVYNALSKEFPRTSVFVTHDMDEALLFADKIFVMRSGVRTDAEFDISTPRETRTLFSEEAANIKKKMFELLSVK